MKNTTIERAELIAYRKATKRRKRPTIDTQEVYIILGALASLTFGLAFGSLSEPTYSSLMSVFLGYTFGRIFNGYQGKE